MEERGFEVVSGQRLETGGTLPGTPVVFRDEGGAQSEISGSSRRRSMNASRFMEHL